MSVRSLSLFFGPQSPLPAPLAISEALERVEVDSAIGVRATFRLTFRIDDHTLPETPLLDFGQLTRVSLMSTEGSALVILEGVAVVYTLAAGADGKTSLVVSGEDLTRVMDVVLLEQSFPGMPPEVRVRVLLAKYIAFGVTPLVVPPAGPTVPIPSDPVPIRATDYDYIRSLADTAGFQFMLDPGPAPGSSIAYWGPERPMGPEPALSIDFAKLGIETLQLSFDATAPLVRPALPAERITGQGTLDVERAGVRLVPGGGVEVRGAGKPFDGLFRVNRVRHTITHEAHTQAFEIVRVRGS